MANFRATATTARFLPFLPPRSASFRPQRRRSLSAPKGPRIVVRALHHPSVPIMSEASSPSLINVGRRENCHIHEQDQCQTDGVECWGVGGSAAEGGRA